MRTGNLTAFEPVSMQSFVWDEYEDGQAYVLCHAAGATVLEWDGERRLHEMDVLVQFVKDPFEPLEPGSVPRALHEEAYRWARAYNRPGPGRERCLREVGG